MKKFKLLFSTLAICLFLALLSVNINVAQATEVGGTQDELTPGAIITGDEDPASFPSYDITVPLATKNIVVPIKMDYKGQLTVLLEGKSVPAGIDVTLYSDSACTSKVGYSRYLTSSSMSDTLKVSVPQKGTYYLEFNMSSYSKADGMVTITPYSLSSEQKTLKNKQWAGSHYYSYDTSIDHKITVTKPGYIKVEGASSSGYSVYVTLCNSKKAAFSDQIYLSSSKDYSTYFAVKKGTYYIKAKSSDDYKLRYSFTEVKDSAASTKAKAVTIAKGKTKSGLILSEDSVNKVDWYKISISKKQKLSFDVSAKSCDSIKFEVVPASSRVILFGSTFYLYDVYAGTYGTKDSMPAGTYYIKVTKTDKTSSGTYSIKFNK